VNNINTALAIFKRFRARFFVTLQNGMTQQVSQKYHYYILRPLRQTGIWYITKYIDHISNYSNRRTLYSCYYKCNKRNYKGKGKGLDTCYSAAYMSQTRDQQRFTISEVAADWHEPMVPQRTMWPSIARHNGQLDQRCS